VLITRITLRVISGYVTQDYIIIIRKLIFDNQWSKRREYFHPVIAVTENFEKEKFRVLILQKEYLVKGIPSDWIIRNRIKYLIEIVSSDEGSIKWMESANYFSAKVTCGVGNLHIVLQDIFIDAVMENSLIYIKEFKDLTLRTNNSLSLLDEFSKPNFAERIFKTRIEEGMAYIPFSMFFRNKKGGNYDIESAYTFWQKYLLEASNKLTECASINKYQDLIGVLPKRYHEQVNKRRLNTVFNNKCQRNGYYYFVYLHASSIGSTMKVKRRLASIFRGIPNPGAHTIIPFAFGNQLKGLEHLCLIILFEKT
jgi:hypothetical protein